MKRIRILLVVCLLVLSGGTAWAQPALTDGEAAWNSWSQWLEAAKVWLSVMWIGGSNEPSPESETSALEVGGRTGVHEMDGETCSPTDPLWRGATCDPDG